MRFKAIDSFWSEETGSEYVAGLSYEAFQGDELLLRLIPKWIDEGKVREGGPVVGVSGQGSAE